MAVLGGHACALLLVVFTDALRADRSPDPRDDRLAVYFVAPPSPVSEPPDRNSSRAETPQELPRRRREPPVPRASTATPAPPAAGESRAIHPRATIDWDRAARDAATAAASAPGAVPDCEPTGRPDATRPRCPRRGKDFEWQPEEKKAGFAGPLPYFRLGKRCIVMPPFFGCGIGKLPEANGQLFDGMRDADRDRSSVPETPR